MAGATDTNRREDEVSVHLNDELVEGSPVDEANYDNLPSLTDEEGKLARPAKNASIEEWVDYVVSWGADREYVSKDTEHISLTLDENLQPVTAMETHPALTKAQLIELADSLGG